MIILGLSAFYHDSAACLVVNGKIVAAAQEERFTRNKHDPSFPTRAVQFCVKEGNIHPDEINYIVFYDKPFLKFERILESYLHFAPKGARSFVKSMPVWVKEKLFLPRLLKQELNNALGLTRKNRIHWEKRLLFTEHHQSHAASAFFPSPFPRAAVLTLDGVGEWATTSLGVGKDNTLRLLHELHFPHSLGLLYTAFTYYIGFKVNSGEYKVMGLAPYGEPKYVQAIYDNLIDLKEDGSFALNMEFFNYCTGLTMTNGKFDALFGGRPRQPESQLTQREMDLARSVQEVTEEVVLRMTRFLKRETGEKNLCLAGGVVLNCVVNGKIFRERIFENIWIQPAAGDAGGAVGAALAVWYQYLNRPRTVVTNNGDQMQGAYLGPAFSDTEVERFLVTNRIAYRKLPEEGLMHEVAELLAQEKVVGWFQGRMEFGPRALGNRSILGDARSPRMQSVMNLKIKYRESFRPFAPSVLRDKVSDYFDLNYDSPYMLLVAPVRPDRCLQVPVEKQELWGIDRLNISRSNIPAVTHVDYSARVQTIHQETNPRFHTLVKIFAEKTGVPVLINTSFNVRGEPIVCTPEDAFRCFLRTEMDYLVLGNCLLNKAEQKERPQYQDWKDEIPPD